jgi:thiol-disulfide isomerase/thioredoxin
MSPLALAAVLACTLGLRAAPVDVESDAFTAAYALKKNGKSLEAAAAFEAIARAHPDSPRVGEALVEAGVGWFGAGRSGQVLHRSTPASDEAFAKAQSFFESVANDRPKDPAAGRAQYMLGSTALFLGDLAGAETGYGIVLEKFAGDAKYAPKSLERRSAVRRHLLQNDLALDDLHRYQKQFPKGEEIESVNRHAQYTAMMGKPAPALDVETWLQGGPHTLPDLRGRVVALYFFATWCDKCEAQTPFVADLERRLAPAGLVLIGVFNHGKGQTNESVRAFLAEHAIRFPAMMDRGRTQAAYLGQKIPDLVLIDRSGMLRWHDNPEVLSDYTVETLLGEEPGSASPARPK